MARLLIQSTLTMVLAVTLASFSAWAEQPAQLDFRFGPTANGDLPNSTLRHLVEHAKDLGLTDDQTAYLNALQLNFELTRVTTEAERMVAEREIAALLQDDSADVSVVAAKIHHSEAIEAGLRVTALKTLRKALTVLTPEQRDKYRRTLAANGKGVGGKG